MKINCFFEYHYYRVARFFFKRDGTNALSALLSVTSIQFWILVNLFLLLQSLLVEHHARKLFFYEKAGLFILFIGLVYYNHAKYSKNYLKYRERWQDESKNQKVLNGIVVVMTFILAWGLIFINGLLFGRFIK